MNYLSRLRRKKCEEEEGKEKREIIFESPLAKQLHYVPLRLIWWPILRLFKFMTLFCWLLLLMCLPLFIIAKKCNFAFSFVRIENRRRCQFKMLYKSKHVGEEFLISVIKFLWFYNILINFKFILIFNILCQKLNSKIFVMIFFQNHLNFNFFPH